MLVVGPVRRWSPALVDPAGPAVHRRRPRRRGGLGRLPAWAPKVAVGGLLAIHDVFADPADGGRPPYELYCDALASGRYVELEDAGCGSLRVLRRRP